MRQARIKVDAGAGEAVYHCMTRTVNGERLLDDVAKEVLRKQLWALKRVFKRDRLIMVGQQGDTA